MSDTQAKEQTRIITTGLDSLKNDLQLELPKLRHRNDNTEDMYRQLNAWFGMRFRSHMLALGKIAWGMNTRFVVTNEGIKMEARQDTEIGVVVNANAELIKTKMDELFKMATGPVANA